MLRNIRKHGYEILAFLFLTLTAGFYSGSIIFGTYIAAVNMGQIYTPTKEAKLYRSLRTVLFVSVLLIPIIVGAVFIDLYSAAYALISVIATSATCRYLTSHHGNKRDLIGKMLILGSPIMGHALIEFLNKTHPGAYLLSVYLYGIHPYTIYEPRIFPYLFGILFLTFIYHGFRFLFANRRGTVIYWILILVFGVTNYLVLSITGKPFIPSDILIARTALSVLKQQKITGQQILYLTVAVILFIAVIAAAIKTLDNKRPENRRRRIRFMTYGVSGFYLAVIWAFCITAGQNVFLLFNANVKYGELTAFLVQLDYKIHFPAGVEDYLPEKDTGTEAEFNPNVIMILSEAFSDLQGAYDLQVNQNTIPNFNALCGLYPHGTTYVSVLGNNTVSSEWELLSGVSTGLTRKGAIVYGNNAKEMQTLVSIMNGRGYKTIALHPFLQNGYNRKAVYQYHGFDSINFLEQLPNDCKENMLREFVTDQYDYEYLITLYENSKSEAPEQPVFLFNITMQNHASYDEDGGLSDKITTNENCPELDNYLTLLHETDKQFRILTDYFSKIEEPTVILFVGDHQPMLPERYYESKINPDGTMTLEDLRRNYEIPYLIWANYELNAEAVPDKSSMPYLQTILFEVAGIEKTPWMERLDGIRSVYPVVTANFIEDADGNLYDTTEMLVQLPESTDPQIGLLNEYRMRCYGILRGVQ